MENRYDLSFMKEYAKIFDRNNSWLADKFHCGIKIVDKILSGEYKVKEEPLEEIMYEFGYSNYENFKKGIIQKTNERKQNIQKKIIFSPMKFNFNCMENYDRIIISMLCEDEKTNVEKITKFLNLENYDLKKVIKENILTQNKPLLTKEQERITVRNNIHCKTPINEIFDYNLMGNIDRVIVSLLCDENNMFSIKQIAEFINCDTNYVNNIYKTVISNIQYASQFEPEFQKNKA